MVYDWRCQSCNRLVTITTTKFDHSDINPDDINKDEVIIYEVREEGDSCDSHKWKKELGGFKLVRQYSGKKGEW